MAKIGAIILPTTTTTINGQQITYAESTQLQLILNKMATQLDMLSCGQIGAIWNAASAPPTAVGKLITTNPTGAVLGIRYGVGDVIVNKEPETFALNGLTLVTTHWQCTVAGNVGTANPPTFVALASIVVG